MRAQPEPSGGAPPRPGPSPSAPAPRDQDAKTEDEGGTPWERAMVGARRQPALWAIVQRLTLDAIDGTRITLRCPPESVGTAGKIAVPKLVELLSRAGLPGASIVLKATEGQTRPPEAGPSAPAGTARTLEQQPLPPTGPNPADSPLVKRVQQVLGARVTRVVPRKKG